MSECICRKKEAPDEGGLEIWGEGQLLGEESLQDVREGQGHKRR